MTQHPLTVNEGRLLGDLQELAAIGATNDGGVNRPALSEADLAGREWFRQRIRAAGLQLREDGAGNISALLPALEAEARTLLLGSHLDTVPNGGRFDGALGVLAALEVLRTLKETRQQLACHLEAISFTDEEGSLIPLWGSAALAGNLKKEAFVQLRGSRSEMLAALVRSGLSLESSLGAKRNAKDLLAYLEVHIEQGVRLQEAGLKIGVVSAIVGIRSFWLEFGGEAAHAGTKALSERKDALLGAADFALKAREIVLEQFTPGVVNCGILELAPGAFNIVPATVRLSLEFRHGSVELLDEMEEVLLRQAELSTIQYGLTLKPLPVKGIAPAPMHEAVQLAIEGAAETLGLSHARLMSYAGHDPQSLANIIPTGLFFVPCRDGISHNPAEFASNQDCINAANTLLHSTLILAEKAPP